MQLGTKTRTAPAVSRNTHTTGICAGTTIMTLQGEMPVEHLQPGTKVITRDSGMAVLHAVRAEVVKLQPIRIKAGSLGHTRPDRDMMVTPGTQIHIRDWRAEALYGVASANVPAHRLVDGEFLSKEATCEMTVYSLTFDRPHILYADGIEMLSA